MRSPGSSRSPSPPPDDAEAQDAYARLGKLLNLDHLNDVPNTTVQDNEPSQLADEDEEQEFEFRLFSAPTNPKEETTKDSQTDSQQDQKTTNTEAKAAGATQKLRIRLNSPTPGSGDAPEGRFVKSRDWDYYFSTPTLSGTHSGEMSSEDEDRIAEKKKQFDDMAVSGDHMLGWAQSQVWVSAL
jgi:hypothetical protein